MVEALDHGQTYLTVEGIGQLRDAELEAYIAAEEKWWKEFARDAIAHGSSLLPKPDWSYVGEALVHPESVPARDLDITGFDLYSHNCNRNCDFCLAPAGLLHSRDILDIALVEDLLHWATEPGSKIAEITLLGGEFALQPEAARIIKLIGNTRGANGELLRVRIVTNGSPAFQRLLDDPEIVTILLRSRVAVSREALSESLNDEKRGRLATKHFNETVEKLVGLGIRTDMNVTVMRSTYPELPQLIQMAQAMGIRRVNIHGLSLVGNASTNDLDHEELRPDEYEEHVVSVAAALQQAVPPELDFTIDCEVLYAKPHNPSDLEDEEDVSYCAVQSDGNLQITQPIIPGTAATANVCAYYTATPGLSKYVFWKGKLYRRAGHSEATDTVDSSKGCPLKQSLQSGNKPKCLYGCGRLVIGSARFAEKSYPPVGAF